MADANADQAEARLAHLIAQQIAAVGENPRRQLCRTAERAGAGAQLEIGRLELERHRRPGQLRLLQPLRHALGEVPEVLFERPQFADVVVEGRLRRHALGVAHRIDPAHVEPARQLPETRAFLAIAAHQFEPVGALEIGDHAIAVRRQLGGADGADAVDEADRFRRQEFLGVLLAEHGKAARLVDVGGNLGEEFISREAD